MINYKILIEGNALFDAHYQRVEEATGDCTITVVYEISENNKINKKNVILVDPGFGPYFGLSEKIFDEKWQNLCLELEKLDLTPKDITWIFFTHNHVDHCILGDKFTNLGAKILPEMPDKDFADVEIIATPGHSSDSRTLLFIDVNGKQIAIVGDAVINEEYFRLNEIYRANRYSEEEMQLTRQSMKRIAERADIIIPGHGPEFTVNKDE
ncbi:MAG: MBL fold metallo-hydrolase [Candidatus Hodarchaeales archaeon]